MRLSKQLFADSNAKPPDFARMDTESVLDSVFFRRLDSWLLWHNPIVARICHKINTEISTICEDAWFDPVITPSLMNVELLKKSGKFAQFSSEFYVSDEMVLSATSEEYLLALAETSRISYAQLPIRTYELKDAFRNVKRPKWVLKAKQFSGVVMSLLWKNEVEIHDSLCVFSEIMREVSMKLNVVLEYVPKMGGREYVYPLEGGDGFRAEDGRNFTWVGVAMGYPYWLASSFGVHYQTEKNDLAPIHMGTYGIGTLRCLFAAMDSNRDEAGFLLPDTIRPYDCAVIVLNAGDPLQMELADSVAADVKKEGFSVYVDDRKSTMKMKLDFADFIWVEKRFVIWKKECLRWEPEIRGRRLIW